MSKLDILVNNVGIFIGEPVYFNNYSEYFIKEIFTINISTAIKLISIVLRKMEIQKSGLIINNSSIAALSGTPFNVLYNATKVFIDHLTIGLHYDFKRINLAIKSLIPFSVKTKMTKNIKFNLNVSN